jgi:hypothetical protein
MVMVVAVMMSSYFCSLSTLMMIEVLTIMMTGTELLTSERKITTRGLFRT